MPLGGRIMPRTMWLDLTPPERRRVPPEPFRRAYRKRPVSARPVVRQPPLPPVEPWEPGKLAIACFLLCVLLGVALLVIAIAAPFFGNLPLAWYAWLAIALICIVSGARPRF